MMSNPLHRRPSVACGSCGGAALCSAAASPGYPLLSSEIERKKDRRSHELTEVITRDLDNNREGMGWGEDHLVFGPRRGGEGDGLAIEPLDVIELHDLVVVLGPPPLGLPLVKHLPAARSSTKPALQFEHFHKNLRIRFKIESFS